MVVLKVVPVDRGLIVAFCEITSKGPHTPPQFHDRYKILITKWRQAGLSKQSHAQTHMVEEVSEAELKGLIGTMDNQDLAQVIAGVKGYLLEKTKR